MALVNCDVAVDCVPVLGLYLFFSEKRSITLVLLRNLAKCFAPAGITYSSPFPQILRGVFFFIFYSSLFIFPPPRRLCVFWLWVGCGEKKKKKEKSKKKSTPGESAEKA